MTTSTMPTVFNITHPKAGSQWVRAVLTECARDRIVEPQVFTTQFLKDPLVAGGLYPALYLSYSEFSERLACAPLPGGQLIFVVIRDLRDTLVSLYYNLKFSHPLIAERLVHERQELTQKSFEDGFLFLIETRMPSIADIQLSWLPACETGNALLVKYEELLADQPGWFTKIVGHCQLDVSPEYLADIIAHNSFEKRSGRERGQEDVNSHFRKGVSGDWRNHFTDKVRLKFARRFGDVLIKTGYEHDLSWAEIR